MSLTRGNIIDRVAAIIGDGSVAGSTRTHLTTSVDNMLFALWDAHDWNFKHKASSFTTSIGSESKDLSIAATDIRSSQDVEYIYDSTNGRKLVKEDLRTIRNRFPKEDQNGQPYIYAPWGAKVIYMSPNPDGVYTIKFLYLANPALPTSDSDDLETVCGLPRNIQYLFEKMVLAEGWLLIDDTRRQAMLTEVEKMWLPRAIQADMQHLESSARFKFWEEELKSPAMPTYEDFLRKTWWSGD